MVYIVEWDGGAVKFATDAEAREFQRTLPPGSSRWGEPV